MHPTISLFRVGHVAGPVLANMSNSHYLIDGEAMSSVNKVPKSACLLCRHAPSSRLQPSSAAMQCLEAPQCCRAWPGQCGTPCSQHRGKGCRSLPCGIKGCLKGWASVWDITVILDWRDPGDCGMSKTFPCLHCL